MHRTEDVLATLSMIRQHKLDVRTVTTVVPVRFTDVDDWHRWSMSAGQRRIWDTIPADELDAVLADAAVRLDGCRRPDGAMGFDQGVRYTLARR